MKTCVDVHFLHVNAYLENSIKVDLRIAMTVDAENGETPLKAYENWKTDAGHMRHEQFIAYNFQKCFVVFDKIFAALVREGGTPDCLMIDATHIKAHRTAASLLKKGMYPVLSDGPKAA